MIIKHTRDGVRENAHLNDIKHISQISGVPYPVVSKLLKSGCRVGTANYWLEELDVYLLSKPKPKRPPAPDQLNLF